MATIARDIKNKNDSFTVITIKLTLTIQFRQAVRTTENNKQQLTIQMH